jgi:hypothetical protein
MNHEGMKNLVVASEILAAHLMRQTLEGLGAEAAALETTLVPISLPKDYIDTIQSLIERFEDCKGCPKVEICDHKGEAGDNVPTLLGLIFGAGVATLSAKSLQEGG